METLSPKTRSLAALVAVLLALGSSASAVRASEDHPDPGLAPAPTTSAGHEHEAAEEPEMKRVMAGGSARRYSDGEELTYRIEVNQTLQPKGPHPADAQTARMELLLTETVTEDGNGPLVTLEVTEASAEGFLAAQEEATALERRVQFRPGSGEIQLVIKEGPNGTPNLADPETVKPFGDLGAVRMVDMALKAHLLNPVLPSEDYADGDSFEDSGALPAGWALGYQTIDGSITVGANEIREGRDVVRVKGVHISGDNLLRVRAMDNAVEALQGKQKPEPNDFFAGTMFNALFPKGSTYESLMPKLPLETVPQPQTRRRPGPPRKRSRRSLRLVLGCMMLLGLAACNNPERNVDIVSLNVVGPMQVDHDSVVDEDTGVLLSSRVEASIRLTGQVYPIPEGVMPLIPENLRVLSRADIGMDADWTITEELQSEVPEGSAFASFAPRALIVVGAVVLLLALVLFLRKRSRPSGPDSAPAEKSEAA
ncbi:MAG TPA: hypothetical protein VHI31_00065 [Actinomycetota bacterium]|nr:hypothetical protein [Actinomycetota bacterium]